MSISLTAFTFVNLLLKKVGVKTYYKPLKAFYSDQLHHCFFFSLLVTSTCLSCRMLVPLTVKICYTVKVADKSRRSTYFNG